MRLLDPSYGSFSPLDRLTPHQGLSCPEGKSLGITGAESRVRATVVTWLHSCGSNKVGGHLNLLSPQEEGTGSGRTPSHLRSQGQDTVGQGEVGAAVLVVRGGRQQGRAKWSDSLCISKMELEGFGDASGGRASEGQEGGR